MEATTNLIGGQPFSMANLREVKALIEPLGIFLVVDGSLISENAYFIRQREAGYENTSIRDIVREVMEVADLCYLSARKSCFGARRPDRHQPQGPFRARSARGCRSTKASTPTAACLRRKSKPWPWACAK